MAKTLNNKKSKYIFDTQRISYAKSGEISDKILILEFEKKNYYSNPFVIAEMCSNILLQPLNYIHILQDNNNESKEIKLKRFPQAISIMQRNPEFSTLRSSGNLDLDARLETRGEKYLVILNSNITKLAKGYKTSEFYLNLCKVLNVKEVSIN